MRDRAKMIALGACALFTLACVNPFYQALEESRLELDAQIPIISVQPAASSTVSLGQALSLSVSASVDDGGSLSYVWHSTETADNSGGAVIGGATGARYDPPTDQLGTFHYYCVVTNTNDSARGAKTANAASSVAVVTVAAVVDAQTPTISVQPGDATINQGDAASLEVEASVSDGGSLSWQWYAGATEDFGSAAAIDGATAASYEAPTDQAGTFYFWCVVTNTNPSATGLTTATVSSEAATVTVLGGSGIDIDFN